MSHGKTVQLVKIFTGRVVQITQVSRVRVQ